MAMILPDIEPGKKWHKSPFMYGFDEHLYEKSQVNISRSRRGGEIGRKSIHKGRAAESWTALRRSTTDRVAP